MSDSKSSPSLWEQSAKRRRKVTLVLLVVVSLVLLLKIWVDLSKRPALGFSLQFIVEEIFGLGAIALLLALRWIESRPLPNKTKRRFVLRCIEVSSICILFTVAGEELIYRVSYEALPGAFACAATYFFGLMAGCFGSEGEIREAYGLPPEEE